MIIGTTAGAVSSCSVDNSGNVAAVLHYDGFAFAVAVLPGFTGQPKLYSDSAIYDFLSVGYDGAGNLFLLGSSVVNGGGTHYLAELPNGGSAFEPLSLNLGSKAAFVRTVQWDGNYVTIQGSYGTGKSRHGSRLFTAL